MITGEGGFVHRMMPSVDWDCGDVPAECYNASLSSREIEGILRPIYLNEERIKKLADSDDPMELLTAELALETLVEIDAKTIWCFNIAKASENG